MLGFVLFQLMELQSRFGTDKRFRMDSRFLEDEEEEEKREESGVAAYLYSLTQRFYVWVWSGGQFSVLPFVKLVFLQIVYSILRLCLLTYYICLDLYFSLIIKVKHALLPLYPL